jgi:hypothetical protein
MDVLPVGLPMINVIGGFGIGEPSPLAPVLRRFDQRSPLRRRMPGTPSIHFDYDGWFREIGINVPSDLASDFDTCEALSADHFVWAMQMFQSRVYSRGDANFKTVAGTIYHAADRYYYALRQRIPRITRLLAGMRLGGPWTRPEIPDSDFETSALRFASVFALAARTVAAGWSSYPEATGWLFEEFHQSSGPKRSVISVITSLFMLAPELLTTPGGIQARVAQAPGESPSLYCRRSQRDRGHGHRERKNRMFLVQDLGCAAQRT